MATTTKNTNNAATLRATLRALGFRHAFLPTSLDLVRIVTNDNVQIDVVIYDGDDRCHLTVYTSQARLIKYEMDFSFFVPATVTAEAIKAVIAAESK